LERGNANQFKKRKEEERKEKKKIIVECLFGKL
jgi:hypothetical protein